MCACVCVHVSRLEHLLSPSNIYDVALVFIVLRLKAQQPFLISSVNSAVLKGGVKDKDTKKRRKKLNKILNLNKSRQTRMKADRQTDRMERNILHFDCQNLKWLNI